MTGTDATGDLVYLFVDAGLDAANNLAAPLFAIRALEDSMPYCICLATLHAY